MSFHQFHHDSRNDEDDGYNDDDDDNDDNYGDDDDDDYDDDDDDGHPAKHSAGEVEAELWSSEPICIMTMIMMTIIMIIIRSQHDEYVKADQRKLQQKSMLIRGNWRKVKLIRGNCQKNADHRWAGENWSKMR